VGHFSGIGYLRDPIPVTICLYAQFPCGRRALDIYPFAKQFTYYPQFVLGSIFSVGFLTSVQSLNVNPLSRGVLAPSTCFFAANNLNGSWIHLDLERIGEIST
jgi:hypothetical protein